MNVAKFTSNQLIIVDKPSTGRIVGYSITGVGIILMVTNLQRVQRDFLFWMGLALGMAGLAFQSFLREDTTCSLDKETGLLIITRNMGFLRTFQEKTAIENISKIRIEVKNQDNDRQKKTNPDKYRISLRLGDEQWLPITRKFLDKDLKEMEKIAGNIQQFISE